MGRGIPGLVVTFNLAPLQKPTPYDEQMSTDRWGLTMIKQKTISKWQYLDGDHEMPLVLEELVSVDSHDPSLVGLSDVGKDGVDHGDEHSVLVGVTGILNDGDDIGALLGHVDEIASGSVGELNGIDHALL